MENNMYIKFDQYFNQVSQCQAISFVFKLMIIEKDSIFKYCGPFFSSKIFATLWKINSYKI